MGRTESERERILRNLRERNPSFSLKVQRTLKSIPDDILCCKKATEAFCLRMLRLRANNQLTQQELGDILGVSHAWIGKTEKITSKNNELDEGHPIDRWLLEAVSLVYQVSPLYMVGETDETGLYEEETEDGGTTRLISPFYEPEAPVLNRAKSIVMALYHEAPENDASEETVRAVADVNLLNAFVKICSAKPQHQETIKRSLLTAPHISEKSKVELFFDDESENAEWEYFLNGCKEPNKAHNAVMWLCDLGVENYALLDLMAHFALADYELKQTVFSWLYTGGFLAKPWGYGQNSQEFKVAKTCADVSVPDNKLLLPDDAPSRRYMTRSKNKL